MQFHRLLLFNWLPRASWKQPVQAVDFLGAAVADEERGEIGVEAGPGAGTELFGEGMEPIEVDYAFEFGVLDMHSIVGGILRLYSVEINVRTVRRPRQVANDADT